jgi:SAM-dependent methyltransferase
VSDPAYAFRVGVPALIIASDETVRPCSRAFASSAHAAGIRWALHGAVGHVAYRAAELRALNGHDFPRPVLDLGCGDGQFGAAMLGPPPDAAVDASGRQVERAAASGGRTAVTQADARRLPFADGSFATVVSVSVLEHVDHADRAIRETFRVLRPGGRCAMTIALVDLHDHLFYPALCRRLHLPALGRAYVRLHDRIFKHVSLRSQQDWERDFETAGFRFIESRKICSPRLTRLWDALLPLAVPGRVLSAIGLRTASPPRAWRDWLWGRFEPLVEEDTGEGSSLLIVAEKP